MPPVKRLRYYDGELLRAADLQAEQDYHSGLRRQHNRTLWSAGVAEGLDVVASGPSAVVVKAGRAVDSAGRDIVLTADSPPVDLSATAVGAEVLVTIAFGEQQSDPSTPPSAAGNTRITEQPTIATATAPPAEGSPQLVLAKVERRASSVDVIQDESGRRPIELRSDTLSVAGGAKFGGDLTLTGKIAVRSDDNWLRLNQEQEFDGGTWARGYFATESVNIGGANQWANPGLGNVAISGSLTAFGEIFSPAKHFLIDHPLDPERRHLVHQSLEGPEAGVYYRGEARLENGEARVELPDYFEALTRADGRSVMITPQLEGDELVSALGASRVEDGAFRVRTIDGSASSQPFFWEVKAVRADLDPLVVERDKQVSAAPVGENHG